MIACNSSNIDGAEGGLHTYCCDDYCCDSGSLDARVVPLGGQFMISAMWDNETSMFTTAPEAGYVPWVGATATDSIYGYDTAWVATATLSQSSASMTDTIRMMSYSTTTSYSDSASVSSFSTSSTSMLSYSTPIPTIYTYTPSAESTSYTDFPTPAKDTAAALPTSKPISSSSPTQQSDTSNQNTNTGSTHSNLNKAQYIGIGVGIGATAIALILAILYCRRRRKMRSIHNTVDSHNNPRHFGMRRDSDLPETASMIAEADPAHEVPHELGGRTWVEAPEKGSRSDSESTPKERSQPDEVAGNREYYKPRLSHGQDEAQT